MKKILFLPILLLTLFVSVNKVSADTYKTSYISGYWRNFTFYQSFSTDYSSVLSNFISYYQSNWQSSYSDYIIYCESITGPSNQLNTPSNCYIAPTNISTVASSYSSVNSGNNSFALYDVNNRDVYHVPRYQYNFANDTYSLLPSSSQVGVWFQMAYSSSTLLTYVSQKTLAYHTNEAQIPSYSNLDYDFSYPLTTINVSDSVPTFYTLTNNQPSADFTEVDMSQYEYIILSLRDYNTTTFNTTIYSLGRLCFTPVYNYGMTPKQDYFDGYQTQGCTEYYNTSTPVSIYIIQADLDNHAVYYIKRYENETNILQIPTSIFDITYVTSQNANNPQVSINGRSYPAIPYSQLIDTANISTNEGYISGQVCALGDINCQTYESGMDISDLFTQPLKVLQSVWTSITSVFILIGEFIALIPSPLKEFLISAFMLSIILGILKIIL